MLAHRTPSDITIRAVRPDDKQAIVSAFRALDRESVYLRFFCYRKELSEKELRSVTECDGVRTVVLVATAGSAERQLIVGLASYVRTGADAEIAFAVAKDFRGYGIASRLLRELVRIAGPSGIAHFDADVLAENGPMLAVLRHSGLPLHTSREQGVVHATLSLPRKVA